MKRYFKVIAVIAVTALLTACSCSSNKSQTGNNDAESVEAQDGTTGQKAPDFTLKSIDGRTITLSEMLDKYVVLDFWGSWCPWCIKGFPDMKESYKKYSAKINFIGIDCNDSDEDWRDAVANNHLPWTQVYVPQSSDIIEKYGINGFPTKIVIDEDGNILRTFVGEDPEFYKYLDEIMK